MGKPRTASTIEAGHRPQCCSWRFGPASIRRNGLPLKRGATIKCTFRTGLLAGKAPSEVSKGEARPRCR